MGKIKNFILWNYSRETSIYVVFCLVIVAFIFLTPKHWFVGRGMLATRTRQVTVKATEVSIDKEAMETKVRDLMKDPSIDVVGWRESKDTSGDRIYEVEVK